MNYATEPVFFPSELWSAISDDLWQISLKLCMKNTNCLQSNYKLAVPDHFWSPQALSVLNESSTYRKKKAVLGPWSWFQNFFFFSSKAGSDSGAQVLFKCQVNFLPKHLSKSGCENTWIWVYLRYVTLAEVKTASTSEHCKPELLVGMFYFCDVFNSVEMWLLTLIWTRYSAGRYYTNFPTQDLLMYLSLNL